MKKILLVALLLRLFIAPLYHHEDIVSTANWGKALSQRGTYQFYAYDTPDAEPPNYPPAYFLIFLTNTKIYEQTVNLLWQANINIKLFPSNFYTWFESQSGRIYFNKLPAIFSDLLIGIIIYLAIKRISSYKKAVYAMTAYLFTPPVWYISAIWGQTESIFALPLLLSFVLLHKRFFILSSLLFTLAVLIKPLPLLVAPVYAYYFLKNSNRITLLLSAFFSTMIFTLIHIPFEPYNTLSWIIKLYTHDVREILSYIVANTFNLWSIIYGFTPTLDTTTLLGVQILFLGLLIYFVITIYILRHLGKKLTLNHIFYSSTLISLASFLFLTRIHERYEYMVFLFLSPIAALYPNTRKWFWILSAIGFANLYHFWWYPTIPLLISLLSSRIIEILLALVNIFVFFKLIKRYSLKLATRTKLL